MHIRYLRELHADDPVRVTFQLLDYDSKRIHYFEELHHAEEGWLSATSENMTLHVDMTAKKTAPFPDFITARLARMKAAHAHLPPPDGVGRRIAMPKGLEFFAAKSLMVEILNGILPWERRSLISRTPRRPGWSANLPN